MIRFVQGDIFESGAEATVNTVNCVGVMGRGIALQFKRAFPDNFKAYAAACKRGEVQPGRMFVFETQSLTPPRYIINFPTKRDWREPSRFEDIRSGLDDLLRVIQVRGIRSISIPPLGSGQGRLEWSLVRPLIEQTLNSLPDVDVVVYEPLPEGVSAPSRVSREAPRLTRGRAALVGLMWRYLQGLMDPTITLLEVHKLLYFLQLSGEPLKLTFQKAQYGPYAEKLRHVLNDIEGHYIQGYADGGDSPDKELSLLPGSVQSSEIVLNAHADTRAHFDRVADLVDGFESPFGLELLATVHWVMTREQASDLEAIKDATYAWNLRKKRFSPTQIELAARHLRNHDWTSSASA